MIVFVLLSASRIVHADDGEHDIPPASLPGPIVSAIASRYPSASIVAASSETERGKEVFEASIAVGVRHIDLAFSADGTLLEEEETIDPATLPQAVQTAWPKAYPGATLHEAERASVGGRTQYELQLVKKSKSFEAVFDEAGHPLEHHDSEGQD